jgi:hypothetical protein
MVPPPPSLAPAPPPLANPGRRACPRTRYMGSFCAGADRCSRPRTPCIGSSRPGADRCPRTRTSCICPFVAGVGRVSCRCDSLACDVGPAFWHVIVDAIEGKVCMYKWCVCVFITAGPSTKLFAWGGGGYGRTCATRDDEPRPV